jgi:hypothetical protein
VLAVVQDQQGTAAGQRAEQAAERVDLLGGHPGRAARGEQHLLAQAERGQRGGRDLGRVADRGQLDQPHPVGHGGQLGPGRLDGQPGLACPAGAGEREQAVRAEQAGDLGELVVAADEAGQPGGQVGARCGLGELGEELGVQRG